MIVETGQGLSNANSYVPLDFANEYYRERNFTEWFTLGIETQEAALIEATMYIDSNYQVNVGEATNSDQSLQFPRTGVCNVNGRVYESNEIPTQLKWAVLEVAKRVVKGEDVNSIDERPTKYEKAGSVEVGYFSADNQKTHRIVQSLMEAITCGGVVSAGDRIYGRTYRG
jgi:hypothetical protein